MKLSIFHLFIGHLDIFSFVKCLFQSLAYFSIGYSIHFSSWFIGIPHTLWVWACRQLWLRRIFLLPIHGLPFAFFSFLFFFFILLLLECKNQFLKLYFVTNEFSRLIISNTFSVDFFWIFYVKSHIVCEGGVLFLVHCIFKFVFPTLSNWLGMPCVW